MAIRQTGGQLTFSGTGTVVTNTGTGFLTGHADLFNENRASLTDTGKHTRFSVEDNSSLFNIGNGTMLTNKDGATLTVRHANLLNVDGATLTNTGIGTRLINEANSHLTNAGDGTTLVNEHGATLINSHASLVNADGATLSNTATGTIENRDHGVFVNQASLSNNGDFDNRALFDDLAGGVVSGSGTYVQSHGGSTLIYGSFTQQTLHLFGGSFTAYGAVTINGNVVNDSTISIDGSSLTVGGNVTGHGTIDITDGSVTFDGAVSSGQTVIVDPSTITIEDPGAFSGTLNLSGGDQVIVDGVTGGSYANGVFTFTESDGQVVTIKAPGYSNSDFSFSSSGGNLVINDTEPVPCFCRGTLILMAGGHEVPVEQLRVGDLVMTLAGAAQPITWIGSGRRVLAGGDPQARPVIVRAGALAEGVPRRDLYLTPGHSLYLEGVLIPVEALVNDRSILRDETASVVEYYHIELQDHDVLLAEGAAAESYHDDANRDLFDNPDTPRFAAANKPHYAPVVSSGSQVDRVWRELLGRAGFVAPAATADPDLHLVADGERIEPEPDAARQGFQGLYRFRLDRAPVQLTIASRHFEPRRLGLGRDARQLGVALRSVALAGDGCGVSLGWSSVRLDAGFHAPEAEPRHRWTDGSAPLPRSCVTLFDGAFEVVLDIVSTGQYPLAEPQAAIPRAA